MSFGRLGAAALGVGSAILLVAGAACSQSYGANVAPVDVAAEAGGGDANVEAEAGELLAESGTPDAASNVKELANGFGDLEGIAATETTVYVLEHSRGNVLALPI